MIRFKAIQRLRLGVQFFYPIMYIGLSGKLNFLKNRLPLDML